MRKLAMKKSAKANELASLPFTRNQMVGALVLIVVFWSTLATWAALAPIGGAVIASGIVSVESHRQAVQHLEGGIIKRINVKEGSKVRSGETLIELQDVAAAANVDRIRTQYFEALAATARLAAERDDKPSIEFPEALTSAQDHADVARNAMTSQRRIFRSRRELRQQKLAVLERRIERLRQEIEGLGGRIKAFQQQVGLADGELADATSLLQKQLIRKSRVTEIGRLKAELEGRLSEAQGRSSQALQQVAELELAKSELALSMLAEVADEIRLRQARAYELSRELVTALDVLARTHVKAPIDGTVVGLQVHSRDGVIAQGQVLMEILPQGDDLVVEARVRPEDIEEVRPGLPAQIVLNTLSRRYITPFSGSVVAVSADRLLDKLNARPYYLVRVKLDGSPIPAEESTLMAGMSADVFVRTGERTALAYLAAPVLRTLHRGMREK